MKKDRNFIQASRARRRGAMLRKGLIADSGSQDTMPPESTRPAGFDPELLYVECANCGSPVIWEAGRATRILDDAGIDSRELDASCILLTEGCPACVFSREYPVRIFRLSPQGATHIEPLHGHA